jgi:hypothetical protein
VYKDQGGPVLRWTDPRGCLVACVILPLVACLDATPTSSAPDAPSLDRGRAPTLLQCERSNAVSTRGIIGPKGGSISLDGHRLVVPPGAVHRHVRFTMSVPASREVIVDVSADGRSHFTFARPAILTISYARCSGQPLEPAKLRVWFVHEQSHRFLQEMSADADENAHTLSFAIRHLSTYAVAY